jgi:hypothetical protein
MSALKGGVDKGGKWEYKRHTAPNWRAGSHSLETKMLVRTRGLRFLLLPLLALFALPASPALVDFTFTSSVDATSFGLTGSEPLTISFSFDPTMVPFYSTSHGLGDEAAYEVAATYQVGGYTMVTDSDLWIQNRTDYDAFNLSAASYVPGTSITGQLNGYDLNSIFFDLMDLVAPYGMFGSTSLPSDTAFAGQATLIRVDMSTPAGTSGPRILQSFSPGSYSFTAAESGVPEPASIALVGAGLAALVLCRRRRR